MSLTDPNWTDYFKALPLWAKAMVACGVLLIVIGIPLWAFSSLDSWQFNRGVNKDLKNINAVLSNINAVKGQVANDKTNENAAVKDLENAVNAAITSSNATDKTKLETNRALANYQRARNANLPLGTTEDDLRKRLDALGN